MKYRIKKALKSLGLYNVMCYTFLPKRKFIVEPFVYIDKHDGIVRGTLKSRTFYHVTNREKGEEVAEEPAH